MTHLQKQFDKGGAFFDAVYQTFNDYFNLIYTVIDVGAGNGCAGLHFPNYVHFVDRRKPNSFSKINQYFKKTNFEYHECQFQDFVSKQIANKAFIGLHPCGELSDLIIERAVAERSPLAIMPCCHKDSDRYNSDVPFSNNRSVYIEHLRKDYLEKNGFRCILRVIDEIKPPKNRLLVALPK